MATQEWSPLEINQAREYFLYGLPIKNIAQKLGRSPSSINKALTRFGIRSSTQRRHSLPKTTDKTKTRKSKLQPPSFDKKILRKHLDNWVSFWKVCNYLSAENICFYEQSPHGTALEQRTFLIKDKIFSSSQLLLLANKIRVENNQSAFLVDELSW